MKKWKILLLLQVHSYEHHQLHRSNLTMNDLNKQSNKHFSLKLFDKNSRYSYLWHVLSLDFVPSRSWKRPIVHFSVISFVKIVLSFSLLCSFEFEEFIFKNTYLRSDFITSKCTSCYILSPDLQWKYREIWETYLISKTPDENFHKTIGVRKNNPFMNRYRERESTPHKHWYILIFLCARKTERFLQNNEFRNYKFYSKIYWSSVRFCYDHWSFPRHVYINISFDQLDNYFFSFLLSLDNE